LVILDLKVCLEPGGSGFGISADGGRLVFGAWDLDFPRRLASRWVEHFVSGSVEDCEDWMIKL